MKSIKFITLMLVCIVCNYVTAQDLIVKKDGTVIQAKVMKVGTSEVEYKKWTNQDGPQYSIAVADILAINYKNGEKETFENVSVNGNSQTGKNSTTTGNTPTEEKPVIAPDNEKLISLYNNQVVSPVKPKYKDKLARNMFTVWGITNNSVLSDSHITIYFSKVNRPAYKGGPMNVSGYAILVQNKSDETVYVDLANSFKISDTGISAPYYSNKTYSVNRTSGSGGGLNVGAVAGALGIGGAVGTLASGLNVGRGTTSGTTVTETEERILTIPPHGSAALPMDKDVDSKSITEVPESFRPKIIPAINIKLHEYKDICTEEESTSVHRRIITYSTTPDFAKYKRLNIGIYIKGGLGDYHSSLAYLFSNQESMTSTNWDYLLIGPEVWIKSANDDK